jgi:hypothetical protein
MSLIAVAQMWEEDPRAARFFALLFGVFIVFIFAVVRDKK